MARAESGTAGTRLSLRRYSTCNLHWSGPKSWKRYSVGTPPLRRARYRLYTLDEYYTPGSRRYLRDRHGTYVWMGTDCGWEWLSTRPLLNRTPLARLFHALHLHVHTPHDNPNRANPCTTPRSKDTLDT